MVIERLRIWIAAANDERRARCSMPPAEGSLILGFLLCAVCSLVSGFDRLFTAEPRRGRVVVRFPMICSRKSSGSSLLEPTTEERRFLVKARESASRASECIAPPTPSAVPATLAFRCRSMRFTSAIRVSAISGGALKSIWARRKCAAFRSILLEHTSRYRRFSAPAMSSDAGMRSSNRFLIDLSRSWRYPTWNVCVCHGHHFLRKANMAELKPSNVSVGSIAFCSASASAAAADAAASPKMVPP
mmetsp:Transcript_10780/g.35400  ORF Transcript_10780/g.35400 Transcript_10780/m.35400 type:complete len:245 (+) Transcript_10780:117-851(+)